MSQPAQELTGRKYWLLTVEELAAADESPDIVNSYLYSQTRIRTSMPNFNRGRRRRQPAPGRKRPLLKTRDSRTPRPPVCGEVPGNEDQQPAETAAGTDQDEAPQEKEDRFARMRRRNGSS